VACDCHERILTTTPLPIAPTKPKRLVYLGTPEVAVGPLVGLHEAGFEIALVVSMADKRRGRGRKVSPSPVKAAALDLGLDVTDDIGLATTVGADLGVVVAYGRIIKREILDQIPMVNIHFSLLPRWRGAAPVERAVLAGDTDTGVCLMVVSPGLDEGDVYARRSMAIRPDQTVAELKTELSWLGTELVVDQLANGLGTPQPQVGQPSYAKKIDAGEYKLNLDRPANELMGVVRLGQAWTQFRGKRLKVLRAEAHRELSHNREIGTLVGSDLATGHGVLRLVEVQPEGKRAMDAQSWINGIQPRPEEHFG